MRRGPESFPCPRRGLGSYLTQCPPTRWSEGEVTAGHSGRRYGIAFRQPVEPYPVTLDMFNLRERHYHEVETPSSLDRRTQAR
jgi:hypothetical protein